MTKCQNNHLWLTLFQDEGSVCYSDYCDVFRCDGFVENMRKLIDVAGSSAHQQVGLRIIHVKLDIYQALLK